MTTTQAAALSLFRQTATPMPPVSYLTARLALDEQTQADAYAVRHASYLSGGYIDPQPNGLFADADDRAGHSRSLVVYKQNRPVASVRLCQLDQDPGAPVGAEIPAARIFPEAVQRLAASVGRDRPARLIEINRLVHHPDFAADFELVFVLFRFVGFMVTSAGADMTLSCVRRNHTPFYKRMQFDYVDGPRRYAGVKFETNLMACPRARYAKVVRDIPFVGGATGADTHYAALLHGETVSVFAEA